MRIAAALTTALALAVTPAAGDVLLTQQPCTAYGAAVTAPAVWQQLGNDQLENLLFTADSLWISDITAGRVRRFAPDGTEGAGLDNVPSPGGLATGPDGLVYAGLSGIANALLRTGAAKVVRFDPADPNGSRTDYAVGLDMANGLTFGPGADLYVSNDVDAGPVRIPWTPRSAALPVTGGPRGWHPIADVWGANGLVVDPAGEHLYAAITFDQRSPIEQIDLAGERPRAPHPHRTHVQLTTGVVSLEPAVHTDPDLDAPLLGVKGLDDMTRDATGTLYVVANGTGELIRVDPDLPGNGCLVTSGLRNPSSVRIAPAGSAFDTSGESLTFYVTEFSGRIVTVGLTP